MGKVTFQKATLVAAVVMTVVLSMELGGAAADCNEQSIMSQLTVCINELNKPVDTNSACCKNLKSIHDNLKPDDACICKVISEPVVVNAGLTTAEAKRFITGCVGVSALPSCLK